LLLALCLFTFMNVHAQSGGMSIETLPTSCNGKTINVSIKTDVWTLITSTQFTLSWDSNMLDYLSHNTPNSLFGDFMFGVTLVDDGKLTCSWFDNSTQGFTVEDEVAFVVTFQIVGEEGDAADISFTGEAASIEFTYNNGGSIEIYEPVLADGQIMIQSPIVGDVDIENDNNNGSNGSISVTPTLGTGPYDVIWDNGEDGMNISNLAAGMYKCTVTDAHACSTANGPYQVQAITATEDIEGLNAFELTPNPASDFVNINVAFAQNEKTNIRILDVTGKVMFQNTKDGNAFTLEVPVSDFANGTYFVEIATEKGTAVERLVVAK